jgi:hypothetical protein
VAGSENVFEFAGVHDPRLADQFIDIVAAHPGSSEITSGARMSANAE